jgi:hypothetical protein
MLTTPPPLAAAVKEALPSASATGVATIPDAPRETGAAVTAPVEELIEIVWKPFCDRTGPEKVVLAIKASHTNCTYQSVCRQPGLSDT